MNGPLATDLALGPWVWLLLTFVGCVTLFFKFSRVWSVRNLDLLLLFVLVPGMFQIVANPARHPWTAYVWLFVGSGLWLIRCLLDLGLTRRPLLEPNLSGPGLLCLSVSILGLLLCETVSLPVDEGAARNPAEPTGREDRPPNAPGNDHPTVKSVINTAAPFLPTLLQRQLPQVIASRVLAVIAHIALVVGLIAIGWKLFERPISGYAMATCYLLLPYTRMSLVDSGQLISSALIVLAVLFHARPILAGALIGLAAGWIPACLGLIVLWCGYLKGWNAVRFGVTAVGVVVMCVCLGLWVPGLREWASALGARSIAQVGLFPMSEPISERSFWKSMDSSFRLPVVIAYLALVGATAFWPAEKNLAELIALSAALLAASQFWYLDKGGTLVMLYLPLAIAVMFRPTISARRLSSRALRRRAERQSMYPSS